MLDEARCTVKNEESYWSRRARRAYSRRTLLRAVAGTGAGLTALALAGCKSTGGTRSSTAPGTQAPATGAAARPSDKLLLGRSGTQPANETPRTGGTVTWAAGSNPPSLDPHRTSSAFTNDLLSPVLSRLLQYAPVWDSIQSLDRKIVPGLASSVESPDGATWTLKLQPNAKFHNVPPVNGHAVEAEDIKATFTRALASTNPSRGVFDMVDPNKIDTPSSDTVVLKLNYPYAPMQSLMASGTYCWMLPREALAGTYDLTKTVIGSGPFTLDKYTPDVALTYKKNPDYFEKGLPYIDNAQINIVPDANAQLAQFTAGHLARVTNIATSDLPTAQQQNPNADSIPLWEHGGEVIYFQLRDPASPFQDIKLRRALSLAVDRDAVGKATSADRYALSFNVTLDEGKWAIRSEDLPADTAQWYKYNPQMAKQMFDQFGLTGKSFKYLFPWPHPRGEPLRKAVQAIFSMLKTLPWDLNYVEIDYTREWVGGGKGVRYGNFPPTSLVVTGIEGSSGYDGYLYNWWDSHSSSGISGLNDAKFDSMIDKARTLTDESERLKAYLDIQQYLAAQMISVTGMPNGVVTTLLQPSVRNYSPGDTVSGHQLSRVWLKQ
jgi:peptide/nickel transport system substrate-binding protein